MGMGRKIKLGTILLSGMFVLGTAILLFNVRKVMACNPPCDGTLSCRVDPDNQTICEGGSVTFACTPINGSPSFTYCWTGPNGFNTNVAAFTINGVHTADAGSYTCTVTDSKGCTSESAGTLIIISVDKIIGPKCINVGDTLSTADFTITSYPIGHENCLSIDNVDPKKFKNTGTITVHLKVKCTCSSSPITTIRSHEIEVVDPKKHLNPVTLHFDSIQAALNGSWSAVSSQLKPLVPTCDINLPTITPTAKKYTFLKCCDSSVIQSGNGASGGATIKGSQIECMVPGAGYKIGNWFWLGVSIYTEVNGNIHISSDANPCTGFSQSCLDVSGLAVIGVKGQIKAKLPTICDATVAGMAHSGADLKAHCCPGADGSFAINFHALALDGTVTITTPFGSCEPRHWHKDILGPISTPPVSFSCPAFN